MNISIRDVTEDNWRDVVKLELHEIQTNYVAPNVHSLAEASYRTHCLPRAIYLDDRVVGFMMYAPLEPFDNPTEYEIFRFMKPGLVLLAVDPEALGDSLRWEASRGGALFPHLYGALPLAAVRDIWELPLGPDSRHVFPPLVPGPSLPGSGGSR